MLIMVVNNKLQLGHPHTLKCGISLPRVLQIPTFSHNFLYLLCEAIFSQLTYLENSSNVSQTSQDSSSVRLCLIACKTHWEVRFLWLCHTSFMYAPSSSIHTHTLCRNYFVQEASFFAMRNQHSSPLYPQCLVQCLA